MDNNNLSTIHQKSKLILGKSKSLLDVTQKILAQKINRGMVESFNYKPFLMQQYHHSSFVYSVAISPDGNILVSGNNDHTIKTWDIFSGQFLKIFKGHSNSVTCLAISNDGKAIVSGSRDKTIKIWDLYGNGSSRTLQMCSSQVNSITMSPDGETFVSVHGNTLNLWNLHSGKLMQTLNGHSKSKKLIRSLFMALSGRKAQKGHASYVYCVAISPDGKTVVSGSNDKTIKIWDLYHGECIKTLEGHSDSVHCVSISPDSKTVVSGSNDKTLKIWDLKQAKCLKTLKGHSSGVNSVAISPDGNTIVSGSNDKTLKIWDLPSGKWLQTRNEHSGSVTSVAISPDGSTIVSGSYDETLKIWNLHSGKELCTLNYRSEVAIDNNGYFIASDEAIDKHIRIGQVPLTQRKLKKKEIEHFRKKVL